jgi:diadenylate cyclase
MENIISIVKDYFRPFLEIIVLWFIVYHIIIFARETGGFRVLRGLLVIVVFLFLTRLLGLNTLNLILTQLLSMSVLGFFILFQPELRKGLIKLGQDPSLFPTAYKRSIQSIEQIANACFMLSEKRIGGLVAIEREADLSSYAENGIVLDSNITQEMFESIFIPTSPLHDGGVIIKADKIFAAACVFPLSSDINLSKTMGTRRRAAIGLSEETDAIIVVVSEETGRVSVAMHGQMEFVSGKNLLVRILKTGLGIKKDKGILSEIFVFNKA